MIEDLVGALLEPVLAFICRLLLYVLSYLLFYPLFCILSTPVVLVLAAFGPGNYADKVVSGYKGVCAFLAQMSPF